MPSATAAVEAAFVTPGAGLSTLIGGAARVGRLGSFPAREAHHVAVPPAVQVSAVPTAHARARLRRRILCRYGQKRQSEKVESACNEAANSGGLQWSN
jgi:hypothetical protein